MNKSPWKWFTSDPWAECPNCHLVQRASSMRQIIQPPETVIYLCKNIGECEKNKREIAAEKKLIEDENLLKGLRPMALATLH